MYICIQLAKPSLFETRVVCLRIMHTCVSIKKIRIISYESRGHTNGFECTNLYIYVYIYVYLYIQLTKEDHWCLCMHLYSVCVSPHHMYVYVYVYVWLTCMFVQVCAQTCLCAYIYIYVCVCAHTYASRWRVHAQHKMKCISFFFFRGFSATQWSRSFVFFITRVFEFLDLEIFCWHATLIRRHGDFKLLPRLVHLCIHA